MADPAFLGESRQQTVGAATIRYRECGSGPPIVFVHGVLVHGDLWRNVVPPLAGRFRCIVPDWPLGAHTQPLPPDADLRPPAVAQLIAGFLEALDVRDVILVANDTGGALAQLVVSERAERVGALVLTNCDSFENFFPPPFGALPALARLPGFVDLLAVALRAASVQRLIWASVTHQRAEPERLRSFFGPVCRDRSVRRDARKFIAAVDPRYTLAAGQRFAAFDRPVGIGWGEDDTFFPMRDARRLCDAFPDARLRTFPGARTFVPEDRPHELADFIAEIGDLAADRAHSKLRAVTQPAH